MQHGASVGGIGKGLCFGVVAGEDEAAFEGEVEAFLGKDAIGGQLDLAAAIEGSGALLELDGNDFGFGQQDQVGDAVDAEGFGFEMALEAKVGGEETVAGEGSVFGQGFLAAVPVDTLLDPEGLGRADAEDFGEKGNAGAEEELAKEGAGEARGHDDPSWAGSRRRSSRRHFGRRRRGDERRPRWQNPFWGRASG